MDRGYIKLRNPLNECACKLVALGMNNKMAWIAELNIWLHKILFGKRKMPNPSELANGLFWHPKLLNQVIANDWYGKLKFLRAWSIQQMNNGNLSGKWKF